MLAPPSLPAGRCLVVGLVAMATMMTSRLLIHLQDLQRRPHDHLPDPGGRAAGQPAHRDRLVQVSSRSCVGTACISQLGRAGQSGRLAQGWHRMGAIAGHPPRGSRAGRGYLQRARPPGCGCARLHPLRVAASASRDTTCTTCAPSGLPVGCLPSAARAACSVRMYMCDSALAMFTASCCVLQIPPAGGAVAKHL